MSITIMLAAYAAARFYRPAAAGSELPPAPAEDDDAARAQKIRAALGVAVGAYFAYGLLVGFAFWVGTDYPYFLLFTK